jgi:hypothetical protein
MPKEATLVYELRPLLHTSEALAPNHVLNTSFKINHARSFFPCLLLVGPGEINGLSQYSIVYIRRLPSSRESLCPLGIYQQRPSRQTVYTLWALGYN